MLGIVRSYRREDFAPDVVAGLTVTVITVPQALAYAFLAGLPPQAGLYACLAPMALYAVLGSSRQLVVGPVAIAALMVATALAEHAPAYSERYAQIAVVLSLQVGLFLCFAAAGAAGRARESAQPSGDSGVRERRRDPHHRKPAGFARRLVENAGGRSRHAACGAWRFVGGG